MVKYVPNISATCKFPLRYVTVIKHHRKTHIKRHTKELSKSPGEEAEDTAAYGNNHTT